MYTKQPQLSPGRKSVLAIAVASTLISGMPMRAQADITSTVSVTQDWTSGGFYVLSTGVITTPSGVAGIAADGGSLGTLLNLGGTISSVINAASSNISGNGTIGVLNTTSNSNTSNTSNTAHQGTIGTLSNAGVISADRGVKNDGLITLLNNAVGGSIIGSSAYPTPKIGVENNGTIGTLDNAGAIHGSTGTGVYNEGTIGRLSNSGTISGDVVGINLNGQTTLLNNSGLITGNTSGISSTGDLGTLSNSGTISGSYGGIYLDGQTTLLNNSGLVTAGGRTGIVSQGSLGTLSNSGTISSGGYAGIYLDGQTTLLNNSGLITGRSTGIFSSGNLGTLSNSGTIVGGSWGGVYIGGTLGVLSNSGLIEGGVVNNGTIGVITNSGTIAGRIYSGDSVALNINGGSGSTFGVLTGGGGGIGESDIGAIYSEAGVTFGSGNLLLNDSIVTADIGSVIGSFDGLGTIANVGATLQLNNFVTMVGNYTQAAGASLIFGVSDDAVPQYSNTSVDSQPIGYGVMSVFGSVNLAAGSTIGLTTTGSTYQFAQGQRYVVIGAADGANTDFNEESLNYSVQGFTASGTALLESDAAYLFVNIDGADGNLATTRNATSALDGLYNYPSVADADLNNLRNAALDAASTSTHEANRVGAQLSPAATASAAATASTGSTQRVLDITSAHLESLRTAQNGGVSGVASGENGSGKGLWNQAFGGRSSQDERDDVSGYHANYGGLLLGADAELSDSWRAGGLFSYAHTSVKNDDDNDGSKADVDSYGLIGYASYTGSPWYVDLSAGVIQHQYDTRREFDVSGVTGTAKGDFDGMQYLASVQAGYPIKLDASTTLTPIAGLTYSTLDQDSYTEKGGNGGALRVESDDFDSLKSDLGAKLERSFSTAYGELIPAAQLTWRHEFKDDGLRSVANFSADVAGETTFVTDGQDAVKDTGVMTLGATLVKSDRLTLSAKYTLEAGDGYTSNTGNVQARWSF